MKHPVGFVIVAKGRTATWRRGFRGAPLLVFLFLTCFCLSSCGGAQFDGVTYRDKELAFRVGPVPLTWRELSSDDARLAFQNDEASATIALSARCRLDSDDVPLAALVQHLFIQLTERVLLSEKEFTLDGRAALETEMTARLDGVQRHFVVTVLKKDGCVYDFLHVDGGGQDPTLLRSREDYRSMVRDFQTL